MRTIIVAGGQIDKSSPVMDRIEGADLIIGANGGAAQALALGLWPHLVVGDMDSLPDEAREALEDRGSRFVIHPRAKDETDLELALTYALKQGADEIIVLGALGGRLDHTLANIFLLCLPELEGIAVRILDGSQEVQVVRSRETVCIQGKSGDLISLLPLGSGARGVSTEGLAWALQDDMLAQGFTRGVSNVMTAPVARVEVDEGFLLIVHGPPEGD